MNYVIVKRSSKIFENSFLKNGILEFWSESLFVSILTYASNDNKDHSQNMIFTKIVMTKFREKFWKSSFMFFSEIQIIKDVYKKHRYRPHLKFEIPTAWGSKMKLESWKKILTKFWAPFLSTRLIFVKKSCFKILFWTLIYTSLKFS